MENVTIEDIRAAAQRLQPFIVRTPLIKAFELSEKTGAQIFLKAENLQRTGSFKFRGAYNALAQIPVEQRHRGVLALSSGNHAQGIAEAGRLLNIATTILMPADAPVVKAERSQASGARVVYYDRATDDRDVVVSELLDELNAIFIHPFNNPHVIAGQGTVGLEIADAFKELGLDCHVVLSCTGGGGLTAGTALAVKDRYPQAELFVVEPEGFDDYARSLEAGTPQSNTQTTGSICDAILTPSPGELGFAINKNLVTAGLSVTDAEVLNAIKYAYGQHRMIVEPGGAVALAALISGKLEAHYGSLADKNIILTLSGGNIDYKILQKALSQ